MNPLQNLNLYLVWFGVLAVTFIIGVILSVAFFTVLERKILASVQRRRGPNVVGIWGFLQAFADALKLLIKQQIFPIGANRFFFTVAPLLVLVAALSGWAVMPSTTFGSLVDHNLSLYLILGISSLSSLGILFAGWSSGSRYGFLGGLRASAQLISYEIVLGFIFFPIVLHSGTASVSGIAAHQAASGVWNAFTYPVLFLIFLVAMLAETNRAPFDLPEAESELVAGFNVEYSSSGFTILFLAEYSSMLLMSTLGAFVFLGGFGPSGSVLVLFFKAVILCCFIVAARGLLPRYRYDQLMRLNWGRLLAVVTVFTAVAGVLSMFYPAEVYFPMGGFDYTIMGRNAWVQDRLKMMLDFCFHMLWYNPDLVEVIVDQTEDMFIFFGIAERNMEAWSDIPWFFLAWRNW